MYLPCSNFNLSLHLSICLPVFKVLSKEIKKEIYSV